MGSFEHLIQDALEKQAKVFDEQRENYESEIADLRERLEEVF